VAWIVVGVTLLAALESGIHVHPEGKVDGLIGQAHSVPLSIVLGADAPSADQHWHAARIVESEACAACLLSRQSANVPGDVARVATGATGVVASSPVHCPPRTNAAPIHSRAPPRLAAS
jgi:hypothetical protein